MAKSLYSSFGLVFVFGAVLILICLYSQDNLLAAITPRPDVARFFNVDLSLKVSTVTDETLPGDRLETAVLDNTTEAEAVNENEAASEAENEVGGSKEDWPYESPVILGWEPDKSTNISLYLQPETNTTLIMPR